MMARVCGAFTDAGGFSKAVRAIDGILNPNDPLGAGELLHQLLHSSDAVCLGALCGRKHPASSETDQPASLFIRKNTVAVLS